MKNKKRKVKNNTFFILWPFVYTEHLVRVNPNPILANHSYSFFRGILVIGQYRIWYAYQVLDVTKAFVDLGIFLLCESSLFYTHDDFFTRFKSRN